MPAKLSLRHLQERQLAHDRDYHKDIWILSTADTVKHMALHHAKYVGSLIEAQEKNDTSRIEKIIVDAFVIALATANALQQDLAASVPQQSGGSTDFISSYAKNVGKLAKACEAQDHVEDFPIRKQMQQSNVDILGVIVAAAQERGLDIAERYEARLRQVEQKSMFDGTFQRAAAQKSLKEKPKSWRKPPTP